MLDKTMLLILSILSWEFLNTLCSPLFNDVIHLEKLSTLYLPYQYVNSTPLYHYREQSVEQSTYDPENKIVYIVGKSFIIIIFNHVHSFSHFYFPLIVHWGDESGQTMELLNVASSK